ncbi:fungal specific transcription factor domain-containing protein [Aspergillus mulundensis]|uniref:Xylanolytic transcriptional activator regulatory domain-containing protein n=1 Tax=Aspergillus mulundensis TaxID=1810919 RepID=A0A3D8RZ06_9EURO|nr:Uncharacterized protein DSM5745_06149 [Aspergillus mulundensis]RDW79297.1 Uncharacterized protein DSM5745_06149 [Aspergillus mulundensis]
MKECDAGCGWWLIVPESVLSELINLFFDKVQGWLPLFHRPRFCKTYLRNGIFDKGISSRITTIDSLLLCGMFALAARHSTNPWFRDIAAQDRGQRFADDALKYYEMSGVSEQTSALQYLQGCILLTFYLYTAGPSHRAWVLAGVCVRLAYEMNLCSMDEQEEDHSVDPSDWSYAEERRRAFWLVWEVDTFGSVMSRRPSSVNRSMMAVRLPVADAAWFADTPVQSPVIDPRPSKAWGILQESPNEHEWAWYIVAHFLMTIASEYAASRHTTRHDEDELAESMACFSLLIAQRFSLESLGFSQPIDAAKHNWVIGMHLMLVCGRSTIRASFAGQFLGLSRHPARVCLQWQPEHILLSHPFLACCLLSDLAYPSEDALKEPDTLAHNNEVVKLVLLQYASVWKLGSVVADLRASLTRGDTPLVAAPIKKRFALYFPSRVKSRRCQNSRVCQPGLLPETTRLGMREDITNTEETTFDRLLAPQEYPHQLPQFTEQTRSIEPGMTDLASPPAGDVSNFLHFYGLNEWALRSSAD